MTPDPTPKKPRFATAALLAAGCALTLFALPATAVPDNSGTIKVHNPDELGDESNDPMVGCLFYIEGFNMAASSGTLVIKSWPPTGNMSVVMNTTWTNDSGNAEDGYHFLNGPYSLPDGHYKVFVSNNQHEKQKTFWVECEENGNGTTTTTGTTTGTTTTPIPVFPSAAAWILGAVGALGGAFLVLRRRL